MPPAARAFIVSAALSLALALIPRSASAQDDDDDAADGGGTEIDDGDKDDAASDEPERDDGESEESNEKSAGSDEASAKPKKKKQKGTPKDVTVGARVFVRNTSRKVITDGAQWRNAYDVSSARLNVDVRKYGWLRGSLEAEFSEDDLELKDVFIRATVYPGVTVQLGNFKRPMSPIALTSIWELPLVERGLLSSRVSTANYLVPLNLGGRSQGAMVTYKSKTGVRPEVNLGLFNARLPSRTSSGGELEDQADNLLRDVYLRGQIEPIDGFVVGGTLVGFTQARFADDLRTRVLGSLDVTLDTRHFRAWLEGFAGRTPFFDGVESVGGLIGLRVLAAGRLHQPTPWVRLIEPYAMLSVLDPTDEKQDNQSTEITAGVATYFRKNLRLQIEYARTINENEFPQPLFQLIDAHEIRLQFGVRFR